MLHEGKHALKLYSGAAYIRRGPGVCSRVHLHACLACYRATLPDDPLTTAPTALNAHVVAVCPLTQVDAQKAKVWSLLLYSRSSTTLAPW